MAKEIRIFAVDNDPAFLRLLKKELEQRKELLLVGYCEEKRKAVSAVATAKPDLVLIGLNVEENCEEEISLSREMRILTDARTLLVAASVNPAMIWKASREALAAGYVLKSQPELLTGTILALGKNGHTAQEYENAYAALSCLSEAEMSVFRNLLGGGYTASVRAENDTESDDADFEKAGAGK